MIHGYSSVILPANTSIDPKKFSDKDDKDNQEEKTGFHTTINQTRISTLEDTSEVVVIKVKGGYFCLVSSTKEIKYIPVS